jgi:hypothetical protein
MKESPPTGQMNSVDPLECSNRFGSGLGPIIDHKRIPSTKRTTRPTKKVHAAGFEPYNPLADPTKGDGVAEEEPLVVVVLLPAGESVPLTLPPSSLPKIGTLMLNFWQTSWKRVVKTDSSDIRQPGRLIKSIEPKKISRGTTTTTTTTEKERRNPFQ